MQQVEIHGLLQAMTVQNADKSEFLKGAPHYPLKAIDPVSGGSSAVDRLYGTSR
jgi:hypothetical protein